MSSKTRNKPKRRITDYNFERLTSKHIEDAKNLVAAHFSTFANYRTTLTSSTADMIQFDAYRTENMIRQNCSTGVFEKCSGKMVGVALGIIVEKNNTELQKLQWYSIEASSKELWWHSIARFMKSLHGDDIFEAIGANRILFQHIIVIDPDHIGINMAYALLKRSFGVAKMLNCEAGVGLLTSPVTLRIAKNKFKMSVLKTVDLTKYIDKETGDSPFAKATPPHHLFTLAYIKLRASLL
uniref:Uncharacterized LOC100184264 n=1 Tax=Ciona intestinalis TaxID=7719 RepID=F6Q950_CIOIN|nr:uncharacterized protein LOC100184264 isoform X2 [Ciona intestinalis]|eukprot:XP_002130428.1 uncharacterized protein LOC100184264 isoform X2 [Ciona intestinalis]